jgi:putative FmdB family regulatory protein
MPTYEYECKSCGHGFEVFQSMSDAPLKICPQCGREIRRLINGGTGVIFKGAGFYVTDKKAAPAKAAKKDGASENSAKSADAGGAACTACAKAESCPGNSGGGAAENKAAG